MPAGYRIRQFLQAAFGRPDAEIREQARALLDPPLWDLFCQMPRAEQTHALRVYRTLLDQGLRQPDLLGAALLHDVGKTRVSSSVFGKVAVVLVRTIAPQAAERWGSGPAIGWRKPFAAARQHPAWGARMIRDAGGSQSLGALVERHHEPDHAGGSSSTDGGLLKALQTADGQN